MARRIRRVRRRHFAQRRWYVRLQCTHCKSKRELASFEKKKHAEMFLSTIRARKGYAVLLSDQWEDP